MDQKLLTDMVYDPARVARVEVPYHDCLSRLENGTIDAVVWNVENRRVGSIRAGSHASGRRSTRRAGDGGHHFNPQR